MDLVLRPKPEHEKCTRQLRSSAGVAVFVSEVSNQAHWVEVGRCYDRFALQATALGIRHAFLNQPMEGQRCGPSLPRHWDWVRNGPIW
ncbi:hypothetical protein IQ273_17850 [Nodosilinea sp. LEGE 07298]|nr:hypothetical protein [Nodosilinea sp. LEGE 07298]MBE9111273.1 hypothetical protein [Nodosilinea sp. LEGE 07298]